MKTNLHFHKLGNSCFSCILLACFAISACSDESSTVPPDYYAPVTADRVGTIPAVIEPEVKVVMPGTKINQLVGDYDRERGEPTQNQTFTRYQLRTTDLGAPFQHGGRTYILFGDTWGKVANGRDAIAYTTDQDPEDGVSLDFVTDNQGIYHPVTIPGIRQGAFEVPMEGISVRNEMYIYHTTDHSPSVTMGRSVVARANDDEGKTFSYLYDLSTRYFINVSVVEVPSADWDFSPEAEGEGLVIFGSGSYRKSSVYLAYQPASEIHNPAAIRYFSGVDEEGIPCWHSSEDKALPLFDLDNPCVGELSVSYNQFLERWILLYNCDNPRGINMRTARNPWGPWSKPQVIFHPWDDDGYCHFIHTSWENQQCDNIHDSGQENVWGGSYGPYQFENLAKGDEGSTTIYFTMSTWNPYTVVLMKAILQKE